MEKIIRIDDKELPLKATAMNMVIYRSQFGKDIMEVTGQIIKCGVKQEYSQLDSLGIARLVWTMAKTYNRDFPDFETWFETVESFPVLDILGDVMELVMSNLTSTTNIQPKKEKRTVK